MVQAGAMLVDEVVSGLRMPVQAEKLPCLEREHRVVITPDVLVFVENGLGREQVGVPASTSPQIGDSHSDVGEGWKLNPCGLAACLVRVRWSMRQVLIPERSKVSSHMSTASGGWSPPRRGVGFLRLGRW